MYRSAHDPVAVFTITHQVRRLSPLSVGPNPVLADQQVLPDHLSPTQVPTSKTLSSPFIKPKIERVHSARDRILNLIRGAYSALNQSTPQLTMHCWLCISSSPSYYEAMAVTGNYTKFTFPPRQCGIPSLNLTLAEVSGQGTCIGKTPTGWGLCKQTVPIPSGSYYLIPPPGTTWACKTGLSPCIHT